MPALTFLYHLLHFVAPAVALAVWVTLGSRLVWRTAQSALGGLEQCLVNVLVGVAVQVLCLLVWGNDGRMATYALLVLAMATAQWLMLRGWRKAAA